MAEQLELTEQLEHSNIDNINTLTPSTSDPSDNPSERTPSKTKTVIINIFCILLAQNIRFEIYVFIIKTKSGIEKTH